MEDVIPKRAALIKDLNKNHGNHKLGDITVDSVVGGMRGINVMFWDLSKLDQNEGITFRNHHLYNVVQNLRDLCNGEPLPEAVLWLLLTGDYPSSNQLSDFKHDLVNRMHIDDSVARIIQSFPKDLHPMSQLSAGMLLLQKGSKFAKAYQSGVHKSKLWEYMLEDTLDISAKTFTLAAYIYNHTFKNNNNILKVDHKLCLTDNFCEWIGFKNNDFKNLMKL